MWWARLVTLSSSMQRLKVEIWAAQSKGMSKRVQSCISRQNSDMLSRCSKLAHHIRPIDSLRQARHTMMPKAPALSNKDKLSEWQPLAPSTRKTNCQPSKSNQKRRASSAAHSVKSNKTCANRWFKLKASTSSNGLSANRHRQWALLMLSPGNTSIGWL